jgi:4-hydroxy-4-methyl-2-oxoglutarate aldolase
MKQPILSDMKNIVLLMLFIFSGLSVFAQETKPVTDEEILKWYTGLRVADVSDGMDAVGLPDVGLMDQKITSLWKDLENFSHRICGIALTVRYTPTNRVVPTNLSESDYDKWAADWYSKISSEPFVESIKPGSIIVLDQQGRVDCGTVGSYNGLFWISKGARGIVTSGGVRDIDEVIKERIPVYIDFEKRGRGIRPGRNEIESFNKPVVVGGVLIRPGDVIVGDGDGVIVVPREKAVAVAKYARKILDGDKNGRRDLYKKMNIPSDKSVE